VNAPQVKHGHALAGSANAFHIRAEVFVHHGHQWTVLGAVNQRVIDPVDQVDQLAGRSDLLARVPK
jgi:hypothetical protein